MLSQLAPSGNMVFSPSRAHQSSPKPSTTSLPSLTATPSQQSSSSLTGGPTTTHYQQGTPSHSTSGNFISPFAQQPLYSSTPNTTDQSINGTPAQFTFPTPLQPQKSAVGTTPSNTAILPPLPLPQFAEINHPALTPMMAVYGNSHGSSGTNSQSLTPNFDPNSTSTPVPLPPQPGNTIPGSRNTEFQDDQIVEKALLEDSFIEHGLLAVDKNVSILGEILNLSEGRDKLFKMFSAILKLIRYGLNTWMPESELTKDIVGRIKSCSSATSTTRLFLKLCTDWIFFRLAARVYYQQRTGMLKFFTLSRLLGMAGYFTFQWPIWFQATGLAKTIDKGFWQRLSLRCYIVSVCSQIFMDMRKAIDLTKEIGYWQLIVPGEALQQLQSHTEVCDTVDAPINSPHPPATISPPHQPTTTLPGPILTTNIAPSSGTTNPTSTPSTRNSPTSPPSAMRARSPSASPDDHVSPSIKPGAASPSNPGNKMTNATSFQKLPSLAQDQDLNPTYALSFQSRLTPQTARYQALLNRTIWQQHLKAQISAAQEMSATPQSPTPTSPGMFRSLLDLPTTLNTRSKTHIAQGQEQLQQQQHLQQQQQQQHPYMAAKSQHDAFSAQLKQLQEETRLALVHENILQKDRNKLFVNFIKDGGDLFGSLDGLYEWGHSDLTLGLISCVSAGISIYRMWAKYKQTIEKALMEEAKEIIRKKDEEQEQQRQAEEDRNRLNEWAQHLRDYYEQVQQQQLQMQQIQLQEQLSVYQAGIQNSLGNNNSNAMMMAMLAQQQQQQQQLQYQQQQQYQQQPSNISAVPSSLFPQSAFLNGSSQRLAQESASPLLTSLSPDQENVIIMDNATTPLPNYNTFTKSNAVTTTHHQLHPNTTKMTQSKTTDNADDVNNGVSVSKQQHQQNHHQQQQSGKKSKNKKGNHGDDDLKFNLSHVDEPSQQPTTTLTIPQQQPQQPTLEPPAQVAITQSHITTYATPRGVATSVSESATKAVVKVGGNDSDDEEEVDKIAQV